MERDENERLQPWYAQISSNDDVDVYKEHSEAGFFLRRWFFWYAKQRAALRSSSFFKILRKIENIDRNMWIANEILPIVSKDLLSTSPHVLRSYPKYLWRDCLIYDDVLDGQVPTYINEAAMI